MKLQTFRIKKSGPIEWEDVRGYPVILAGLEDMAFFTHKFEGGLTPVWRITEVSSGIAFPDRVDSLTRKEAVRTAEKVIAGHENEFRKLVETALIELKVSEE